MKYTKRIIWFALFFIAICIIYYSTRRRAEIDDVWYINLDRDVERNEHYISMASRFGMPVTRFPATYGRDISRDEACFTYGISHFFTEGKDEDEKKRNPNVIFKPGAMGCWISHKRLLTHLNALPLPSNHGHLITEDDIVVSQNFTERWSNIRQNIPYNWDMVYLYTGDTYGEPIAPNILRWKNDKREWKNWGTQAYIVRHGALPKILHELRFMDAPIDNQFYRHLGHLNIYIMDPPLITPAEMESSIVSINSGE